MIKQFFIPTVLGAILFLWLVVTQATSVRTTAMSKSNAGWTYTQLIFGYPPVLEIRPGNHLAVAVYWKNAAMVFAAAYALTMPPGRWISGYRSSSGDWVGPIRSGRRSPGAIMLTVCAGCTLAGMLAAVVISLLDSHLGSLPWLEVWWGLTLMATILLVPITLIVMTVRRVRWRRAFARRGFAVEMVT